MPFKLVWPVHLWGQLCVGQGAFQNYGVRITSGDK